MRKVKVAAVQMDPKIGEIDTNIEKTINFAKEAAKSGAQLVVFPECSLTGYCYSDEESAKKNALTVGDSWNKRLLETAKELNVHLVVGFYELDHSKLYNSALVLEPNGKQSLYRKTHLPELGADKYANEGENSYTIIETDIGNLGIIICYDVRFPEQSRILSLQGADILVHLTNLPLTASDHVDYLLPTRAIENRVYVLSSDRVGLENGNRFLGRSTIYDVTGKKMAEANEIDETIIYAELDLNLAREKDVFYPKAEGKPQAHTNKLFKSRRPDLYSLLSER